MFWSCHLTNSRNSDISKEHGFLRGDIYIGEWSTETNKPHGRGVRIYRTDTIHISYWNNGEDEVTGKYITLCRGDDVVVGEKTIDNDG
jgi:hypothetical protein